MLLYYFTSKFFLWSLRGIKASRFFVQSIWLPIEILFAMCFNSMFISQMLSSVRAFHMLYCYARASCMCQARFHISFIYENEHFIG